MRAEKRIICSEVRCGVSADRTPSSTALTSKTNSAPRNIQLSPVTVLTLWCFCCAPPPTFRCHFQGNRSTRCLRAWWSIKPAAYRNESPSSEKWGGKKQQQKKWVWGSSRDVWVGCVVMNSRPCFLNSAAPVQRLHHYAALSSYIQLPRLIYRRARHSRQTLHQNAVRRFVHWYKCLDRPRDVGCTRETDEWGAFELQSTQMLILDDLHGLIC